MTDKTDILGRLVRMSSELGRPENEYVILGEGNTSAKIDSDTFYVKESGAYLNGITPERFVRVRASKTLDMLDEGELSDQEIKDRLEAAQINPTGGRPSIETVFHAYLLSLPGIKFVGHTHPVTVNTILCSNSAEEIISGRIFPDEIVYCGIRPILVPFADPGITLAKSIKQAVTEYMDTESATPKVILIRNHGLIALGGSADQVEAITAMWVKTARVLAGAYALGGVHYLTKENVDRLYSRPDEAYRLRQFTSN